MVYNVELRSKHNFLLYLLTVFSYINLNIEKGKPAEKRGRKATGLIQLWWQPGYHAKNHGIFMLWFFLCLQRSLSFWNEVFIMPVIMSRVIVYRPSNSPSCKPIYETEAIGDKIYLFRRLMPDEYKRNFYAPEIERSGRIKLKKFDCELEARKYVHEHLSLKNYKTFSLHCRSFIIVKSIHK